ncbi:hypothetical protein [Hydrocarboniphaga effusa]|jgi:hypothetical protein|uniref:hypothetical protein n=1 Tax=Hydrocarboniphaga effusa TaxID=243629 RepID=UPI0035B0F7A4
MLLLGLCVASTSIRAAGFVYRPVGLKLYQADEVVRDRVPGGPIKLGGYVHGLSHVLRDSLSARPAGSGFAGAVVVIVRPGQQSRCWLLTSAELPADWRNALVQALDKVPAPTVRNGPLALAMNFEAWGGAGAQPAQPEGLPTPPEWLSVLGGPAQAPLQDADLGRLWNAPGAR